VIPKKVSRIVLVSIELDFCLEVVVVTGVVVTGMTGVVTVVVTGVPDCDWFMDFCVVVESGGVGVGVGGSNEIMGVT